MPGERSRKIPSRRVWTIERSCSAAIRPSAPWTTNDSCARASTMPSCASLRPRGSGAGLSSRFMVGSLLALVRTANYVGWCHVLTPRAREPRARRPTMKMNAAVVTSFDEPPHYQSFDPPQPRGEHEVLADVLAAGLHPRVRSGASGSHYTTTGQLPLIPGIDGVARLPDGRRAYFVGPETAFGTMADKAIVDMRRVVILPDDADAVKVAAAMNPAMSSWVALRRRVPLEAGQDVLILGVTGNAGQMAVQIAKRLGARRVIGAGRDEGRLSEALSL